MRQGNRWDQNQNVQFVISAWTAVGNLLHMYIGMRGRPYGRTTIRQLLGRKRREKVRMPTLEEAGQHFWDDRLFRRARHDKEKNLQP